MHRGNKEAEEGKIMESRSNARRPPQLIFKQVPWTEIFVTIRYAMLLRFHINISFDSWIFDLIIDKNKTNVEQNNASRDFSEDRPATASLIRPTPYKSRY